MSQTTSRGIADATRWVGVAARMVDYLDQWLATPSSARVAPPRGATLAATRFLHHVLDGVALNRHRSPIPQIPTMAGLSNLTIAIDVLTALPQGTPPDWRTVEESVQAYLACLGAIQENSTNTIEETTVRSLRAFFDELQSQGDRACHAEYARNEQPLA